MTETERLILEHLREMDEADLNLMARGKLQMTHLSDLTLKLKREDKEPRAECCAYHGSGGPEKLACGGDLYTGYDSRPPKVEKILAEIQAAKLG